MLSYKVEENPGYQPQPRHLFWWVPAQATLGYELSLVWLV